MHYLNIDTRSHTASTNYPFTLWSTKSIEGRSLPDNLFISLRICVLKPCALLYISRVLLHGLIITVFIEDTDRDVYLHFYINLQTVNSFIWNLFNAQCGVVQYTTLLYKLLLQSLQLSQRNLLQISASSFVILALCVSVLLTLGGPAQITLNGARLDDSCILLQKNLSYTHTGDVLDAYICFSNLDVLLMSSDSMCLLYVNDTSALGKHIVIKHNVLSDLRVITDSNIKLMGVLDV